MLLPRYEWEKTRPNSTLNIIGKRPTGLCEHCQEPETVEHVLVNCGKYGVERRGFVEEMRRARVGGNGPKDILGWSESERGRRDLISFLTETGLMNRI